MTVQTKTTFRPTLLSVETEPMQRTVSAGRSSSGSAGAKVICCGRTASTSTIIRNASTRRLSSRSTTTPARAVSFSAGSWGHGELAVRDDRGAMFRVRPTAPSPEAPDTATLACDASGSKFSNLRQARRRWFCPPPVATTNDHYAPA